MNSVKKITLLSPVVLAVIVLVAGWNITDAEGSFNCTGEGVWTATDSNGNTWQMLTMPLDNTKKNLGWSLTPVDFDPSLGGAFPTVTTLTPGKGAIQEVSSNLYDYQWVAYGISADREIVYILRSRGTLGFLDCDTVEGSGSLAFYGSWQDPFGEEAPAFGCFPSSSTAVRSPMAPPCEY